MLARRRYGWRCRRRSTSRDTGKAKPTVRSSDRRVAQLCAASPARTVRFGSPPPPPPPHGQLSVPPSLARPRPPPTDGTDSGGGVVPPTQRQRCPPSVLSPRGTVESRMAACLPSPALHRLGPRNPHRWTADDDGPRMRSPRGPAGTYYYSTTRPAYYSTAATTVFQGSRRRRTRVCWTCPGTRHAAAALSHSFQSSSNSDGDGDTPPRSEAETNGTGTDQFVRVLPAGGQARGQGPPCGYAVRQGQIWISGRHSTGKNNNILPRGHPSSPDITLRPLGNSRTQTQPLFS